MATYKVKATYSIDLEIEIDANSEDEAISKFVRMDARDAIDDGIIQRADSEDESAEISEADYTVLVSDICYDPDDGDTSGLPTELRVELKYCKPCDIEEEALNAVSLKTNHSVDFAKVKILEVK